MAYHPISHPLDWPQHVCDSAAQRLEKYSIPEPNSGCSLWLGRVQKHGYGCLQVGSSSLLAHRVAFALEYKYWPSVVRHSCDNPPCVNPQHLLGGTHLDNMRDMVARGRQQMRERHSGAILDENAVEKIKQSLLAGTAASSLARMHGVHVNTIQAIKEGKSWNQRGNWDVLALPKRGLLSHADIAAWRARCGFTKTAAAQILGVPFMTYSSWESGKYKISYAVADVIMEWKFK